MRPFHIDIPDAQIDDLRHRLHQARWPGSIFQPGSEDGASLAFVRRLTDHWMTGFDWRAQETRLNALPQYVTEIDGTVIHYLHQKGRGPAPLPLILTHGWPGAFIEFERLLPLLTDPAGHWGRPRRHIRCGHSLAARLRLLRTAERARCQHQADRRALAHTYAAARL